MPCYNRHRDLTCAAAPRCTERGSDWRSAGSSASPRLERGSDWRGPGSSASPRGTDGFVHELDHTVLGTLLGRPGKVMVSTPFEVAHG